MWELRGIRERESRGGSHGATGELGGDEVWTGWAALLAGPDPWRQWVQVPMGPFDRVVTLRRLKILESFGFGQRWLLVRGVYIDGIGQKGPAKPQTVCGQQP